MIGFVENSTQGMPLIPFSQGLLDFSPGQAFSSECTTEINLCHCLLRLLRLCRSRALLKFRCHDLAMTLPTLSLPSVGFAGKQTLESIVLDGKRGLLSLT